MKSNSLKTNLRLGLGISLTLLLLSSLASYLSIRNLVKSSELVEHSNQVMGVLEGISSTLKDAETGQRGFLITNDTTFLNVYNGAGDKVLKRIDSGINLTTDNAFLQQKFAELRVITVERIAYLKKAIEIKKRENKVIVEDLRRGKDFMDHIRNLMSDMKNNEKALLTTRTANLNKYADYTPILIVFAAILSLLITLVFYRRIALDHEKRILLQNELLKINEDTAQRILVIQSIAQQISSGDYNIRLDSDSKDHLGALASALNSMAESLQYSFSLLSDKEWLQSGVAAINDTMVGEKTVVNLSKDALGAITSHIDGHVGAVYALQEDGQLHLVGDYAVNNKLIKRQFAIGEGIIGECFASKKRILLNKIPDNELTISFGTGKSKPANIIALPLFRNKIVIGVLEVGSLFEFSEKHLEFLENISHNLGLAIYTAQNRQKMQDLLEETQTQAEELQAQTEELQAQHSELENMNAELEAQTQKIQASEEELRVQQEELIQSNHELAERSNLLEEKNELISARNLEIQQKAQQLELSTKYKSEFLANMSHELRTPLNSILLLSRLMAENESLDKEYVEYASVIQSSGQGLLSLIDEILDLSKIEAGKMTIELEVVPIANVANDIKSLFTPITMEKKLDFDVKINVNSITSIKTDRMRLDQILKNLLSNAIKFTSHGKVSIEFLQDESYILFKVSDTGIGIAPSKQGLIFEAFQQEDGSTRRRFGGTGLGLSISRELAKLLGGIILLESTEGIGSVFTLKLPIDPENTKRIEAEEPITPIIIESQEVIKTLVVQQIPEEVDDDRNQLNEAKKIILIIEDDTAFAKALLDFTRKQGYNGIVAVRGDVGIELAQKYMPIAILLDIQLPIKDGWQVMEELKSNATTRHIPVHIMSSLEVKKESLLKGAVDFINKPVTFEQMHAMFKKLEDVLSRSPKKVLIVEENQQHARALSYYLSNYKINSLVAENVSAGIHALQEKEVECVILDMGIPDQNAYETLDTIKKTEGLENLPIIVFTGKNLSKGEESRLKKYADSIVVKTAHSYQRILDEAAVFLHLVEERQNEEKPSKAKQKNLQMQEVLKDKTILIADDDVRNIFSLTKALEQHKVKVLAATDGQEALNVLKEHQNVDLILMDMMMPELDGYESTKKIRTMPEYKNLPIIAVTAKTMVGDREKCIAAGASDYISKPVDIDQLISLLRVWLYDIN